MFARLLVPSIAVLALAASGCGKSVAIGHWIAPEADMGGARRVAITDAYGRGSSVAAITDAALGEARQSAWFEDVVDLGHDRLEIDRDGSAWLHDQDRDGEDLRGDTLYVRLDVLEDSAIVDVQERVEQDADGNEFVVVDESLIAHTLLAVTVADRRGAILLEREVEGISEQAGPLGPFAVEEAQDLAGRAAVAGAFALFTPVQATTQVRLDERDEEANAILARGFDDDSVIDQLARLESTPALYDRAVLTEQDGDIEAAIGLYEAATARSDAEGYYQDTLAGARVRLEDARLLNLR